MVVIVGQDGRIVNFFRWADGLALFVLGISRHRPVLLGVGRPR